jgi:ribosomal protein L40E
MNKLELAENENILKKYDYVWWYGDGLGKGGELYITNKNLIFMYKKGIFNVSYHLVKTPLNKVKNNNGQFSINYNNEEESVELLYPGGHDEYCFDDEETSKKFIREFEEILGGYHNEESYENLQAELHKNEQKICTECGRGNTMNALFCNNCGAKLSFEKSKRENSNSNNKVSSDNKYKCKSCGALLKGNRGQMVKCEYCDYEQIIN